MLATEIIAAIENIANPAWQADWDKSGLQVAAARAHAEHLAVFLDPTPAMLAKALAAGADFLLSHHPLALKPRLPNHLDAWHECLRLLLCANVPLYAAHTSLDVNASGPAAWFADALRLENRAILEPLSGVGGLGYGIVGDLPGAMPIEAAIGRLLGLLGLENALLAGTEPKAVIRRVAYCGGSGASLVGAARVLGADLYVSGDIKHHAALDADIPILDVGHHSIEERMMRQFAAQLAGALPALRVEFFASASPFRLVGLA